MIVPAHRYSNEKHANVKTGIHNSQIIHIDKFKNKAEIANNSRKLEIVHILKYKTKKDILDNYIIISEQFAESKICKKKSIIHSAI